MVGSAGACAIAFVTAAAPPAASAPRTRNFLRSIVSSYQVSLLALQSLAEMRAERLPEPRVEPTCSAPSRRCGRIARDSCRAFVSRTANDRSARGRAFVACGSFEHQLVDPL